MGQGPVAPAGYSEPGFPVLPQGTSFEADLDLRHASLQNLSWVRWVHGSGRVPLLPAPPPQPGAYKGFGSDLS